jgi:acyl carrier protein
MTSNDEILSRVTMVVRKTFHVGDATPVVRDTTSADIAGWDSLAHSVLIMAIEDEFSVELPDDKIFELKDVGELTNLVATTLADSGVA